MYILHSRYRDSIRAMNKYKKSVERFSSAIPSPAESESKFDTSFEVLCTEIKKPGLRDLLKKVLELQEEAVKELELGLDREELETARDLEKKIARQGGIKDKHSDELLMSAKVVPKQLRLFDDTDALIAALREQHEQTRVIIKNSRELERAEKKIMKKNVRQATVSSSFAIVMLTGNALAGGAFLPVSGAAGLFAVHMAFRDLADDDKE